MIGVCRGCRAAVEASEEDANTRDFICRECHQTGVRFDCFGNRLPGAAKEKERFNGGRGDDE